MELISIADYAALHNKDVSSVRKRIHRGGFKTARKIANNWLIDKDETYTDNRIDISVSIMDKVVSDYLKKNSMKEVARMNSISEQKVKKILITCGEYETPTSIQINKLREQGYTPEQIKDKHKISKATVNMYTPYEKAVYNDNLSENAKRIAKSRNKKKEGK